MFFKKKKKNIYPEQAKYNVKDYVNFRYRDELFFGYISDAKLDEKTNKITYTIQICGQCPFFIYDYKEEDIIGLKTK